MEERVCFVVMGYGKKKDPDTNRTIDLDATYKKIIRPAIEAAGCRCIRGDEIIEAGIIDRSMYALLYSADIVIADITTCNPNAIYELGVRHALRPFSTIIIKEDEGKIPFDIGHDKIISYKHLGNEISEQEARRSVPVLRDLIMHVIEMSQIDSPLYTYIPNTKRPEIADDEINSIIGDLKSKEDTIYALTERAKEKRDAKKFCEAEEIWAKLSTKAENDIYYIQQQAFCRYKSEYPTKLRALTDALRIIEKIGNQLDTETLGIMGAINKGLWDETGDISYLNSAIESYKKGWNLYKDYYTGENYANCMYMKYLNTKVKDRDLKTHSKVEAELTFKEIIPIVLKSLDETEPEEIMWKYATLSNSYLALKDTDNAQKYETLFREQNPLQWQIETFEKTKRLYSKKC